MTVLNRLASALNRRDEGPNVDLANSIVKSRDSGAINELVDNLSNKNKKFAADCIKVLYEIGAQNPALIAEFYRDFGRLLESKNNRMVWGAMTALDSIALIEPEGVYGLLVSILDAADSGSVITRDHAVGILTKLGTRKEYAGKCLPLLIKQLETCPTNQFPMYAEMSLRVVTVTNKSSIQRVLAKRLDELEKVSQKKRVEKVLRRMDREF